MSENDNSVFDSINRTVRAYTMHRNLSIGSNSSHYISLNGKRCAVGRYLVDPGYIEQKYSNMSIDEVITREDRGTLIFKKRYREIPVRVWVALQGFHDNRSSINLNEY